jgi:hypothetical protein
VVVAYFDLWPDTIISMGTQARSLDKGTWPIRPAPNKEVDSTGCFWPKAAAHIH